MTTDPTKLVADLEAAGFGSPAEVMAALRDVPVPCMGECKRPGVRPTYKATTIRGTTYVIIHEADCGLTH